LTTALNDINYVYNRREGKNNLPFIFIQKPFNMLIGSSMFRNFEHWLSGTL